MESPVNTKDEDYDNPDADSKCSLFPDADLRYSFYQGALFAEDPLAAELKVITL